MRHPENYKPFKIRYNADPEFRKKHIQYCLDRLKCDICNCDYARSNKSSHEKSRKHQLFIFSRKLNNQELNQILTSVK